MPGLRTPVRGPIRPEPDQARSWLERELARPAYRQSLVDRFYSWLGEWWAGLVQAANDASALSTAAAVSVLAALVVLVLLGVARVRREPSRREDTESVVVAGQESAEQHRVDAEAALRAGSYDVAVVEAFRALAARAVRRGLVQERPGLTARELAADLRPAVPERADELGRSATLFDLVFYGDQPATATDARQVLDLHEAIRVARIGRTAVEDPRPTAAVPR